jgi:hypothetical protein
VSEIVRPRRFPGNNDGRPPGAFVVFRFVIQQMIATMMTRLAELLTRLDFVLR